MTCLTCENYDLQIYPRMTALGAGHCKLDAVGTSIRFSHTCAEFAAIAPAIAAKRIEYEKKLNHDRRAA